MAETSRRRFLATIAGAITSGLAGCTIQFEGTPPGGGPNTGRQRPSNYQPTEAGDRFYQSEPPRERGQTINAADYGSLQAAHDDLPEGGDATLYVPSHSGPYRDLSISRSGISIDSDGAVIEQSGGEGWALGSSSPTRTRETSLAQPIAGGGAEQDGVSNSVGDTTIQVDDASSFSPGDDIHILENSRPFGEPRSGGAKGPDTTEEFRTITDVNHERNTLHIHYPMFLPYPMENRTIVGHVEWTAQDVRVRGLTVRGRGSSDGSHAVEFVGIKNGWFDNLRIENSADDSLAITECYQCRTDGIEMINGGGYGIQIRGSTHTYCTDSLGDGIVNYTVRAGGSAVDVLAEGVIGRNYSGSNEGPVAASHWGSFFVTYRGVTVESEQLVRFRTREMIVEDFDVTGTDTREMVWSQRPFDVLVRDGDIGGYPSGANEKIFHFRLRGDNSPFGNEAGGNIHIEDVRIEPNGAEPGDIGMFSDGCEITDLFISGVFLGDQKITRQHVEQWDGFGQATINNLVVE